MASERADTGPDPLMVERSGIKLTAKARRLWTDRSGATAIEYALIGALVSLMVVAGARVIGTSVNAKFSAVANTIDAVTVP